MSMKLIGNRNNPNCVLEMQWNNKMDLIALAHETGEVTINRFRWDIPIKIPPPDERVLIKSIAWRSDEKILAIAYSNGLINLVDIESKETINSLDVKSDIIKSICWTQNIVEIDESERTILDDHIRYLAELPNLNTITSGGKKMDYKSTKFYSKSMLNFLIVTCENGKILIYIYGVLKCGTIDIRKHAGASDKDKLEILEVKLSSNFKHLYVFYIKNGHIEFIIFENETLLKYHVSLWKLSVKYGMIMNTLNYIEDTIDHINEAWESVLLEMDNKLTKYAKNQSVGAVSADFLELLLFGYPSESLEIFLTQEMTVRELKKLSNSVEMSYSTIQKLVVKPLHNAIINLFYHINNVYGMHQNSYYYKELLGEVTNESMIKTGSFLIKAHELQQTIDKSMRDYKIFFRWLYIVIGRILEDAVPDDAGIITQQETNYLAEFLYNLEEYRTVQENSGETEIKFNLERVGQYLSTNDLLIPSNIDKENLWDDLFANNECLRASKFVYPHNKKASMVQEKNAMRKSIDDLFERIETSIGSDFKLHSKHVLKNDLPPNDFKVISSHYLDNEDSSSIVNMFTILSLENDLLFVACYADCTMKVAKLHFADRSNCSIQNLGQLSFIDVKFYNSKLISCFMKNEIGNKSHSCFMQLSVTRLIDELSEITYSNVINLDMFTLIDEGSLKIIDGFSGSMMAVSGSRKVASFLALNQKIVKLYELEVDEDEPDEDISNVSASFEV